MIKFLQSGNRAAKYILAGFLLILAASMVTYLIPGFMSNTGVTESGVVATVGGHEIRRDEIARLVQNQARGQNLPPAYMSFLAQRVLQQLIQQAEITYEGERMGLNVSDKELRDELQNGNFKAMFFPEGKWIGADQYKLAVQRQYELTVEQFEREVKLELLQRKVFSVVTANTVVPESEVEQTYKDKNTKVKVQYAIIQLDDVLKTIKPTDTELKAYFEANQARYQNAIEEKRQLKYFVLNDKELADKVTVDPAEIQRYYSAHQENFRLPERVKARHILIATPQPPPGGTVDQKAVDEARAKAQDVLKQVKAGGDFAALANKYSTDPGNEDPQTHAKKGGELGWFQKGQMVSEFDKVAFSQNKGQISDLVQTPFGFHIIQTEDKEEAHTKPLAEVRGDIEKVVKQDRLSTLLNKTSNDAIDAAQKEGLEKAAAKYHAEVVQSNLVTRTDALPGIGPQPNFMDAVFTTADKAGPQIGRITAGYVVFQVTKIQPPRKPAYYEEIKDRVTTEFKNDRANDILRRKTQEMADRAHAEHDLAKAAKEAGATVKTSDLVGRASVAPDLGSMSGPASTAFSLKQGEISGPLNLGRSQGVLQVVERQDPSTSDPQFAKERDQLREQLAQQKQQELGNMFLNDLSTRLEKEGKIKINKTEMDSLTKSRG
ncbi:MAG TPA: peptidylprolyl isomerase [Candidatus Angelobacter sp.]|nr:peptidylprolyl isomerase [Candidatus Angelobacter sp.]